MDLKNTLCTKCKKGGWHIFWSLFLPRLNSYGVLNFIKKIITNFALNRFFRVWFTQVYNSISNINDLEKKSRLHIHHYSDCSRLKVPEVGNSAIFKPVHFPKINIKSQVLVSIIFHFDIPFTAKICGYMVHL